MVQVHGPLTGRSPSHEPNAASEVTAGHHFTESTMGVLVEVIDDLEESVSLERGIGVVIYDARYRARPARPLALQNDP